MLSFCRSCNSSNLELFTMREKFPLYIWPLPRNKSTRLEDIHLYLCVDCGYMQLQNMDDNTISDIYGDKAYNIESPEQNKNRYKILTADDNNKFENTSTLEIGGGRNTFVGMLPDSSKKWVADFNIDEGVKNLVDGSYIGDFIAMEIEQSKFDYVFMYHTLEHFNDPSAALKKSKSILKSSGKLIIEVPNFEYEVKTRPYYTVFHMHISLFTKISLLSMLRRHGFDCMNLYRNDDVLLGEFNLPDKSFNKNHKNHSVRILNDLEKNIRRGFEDLSDIFKKIKAEKIAIFGAGGSATLFLHNFPFIMEQISFAIDNDQKKLGQFLCNGKIPIISPDKIEEQKIEYIIVLDSSHIDFLKYKKAKFINIGKLYDM